MFRGWNFLLGEIWVLLLLAILLGLFAGWLIWARGKKVEVSQDTSELDTLRHEADKGASRIADLEAELEVCRAQNAAPVQT